MKRIVFAVTSLLLCQYAQGQQWTCHGLSQAVTHQLTIHDDTIFASTNDGLYKKSLQSTDTVWTLVSFAGSRVVNTLFLDDNECLMLVETDPANYELSVFRSPDRGKTAALFLQDEALFKYPGLNHIAKSPVGKDTIYLLDHNKKTYDGGQTWTDLGHQQLNDNFVYVNPEKTSEVFVGGENFIFNATLQRSADNGQNWHLENTESVFAGDNALHVLHIIDGVWYASGEGIFVKKEPGSANWTQTLNVFSDPEWALYYFGFDHSPVNKNYFYLSGENLNNEKLRLLKSDDRGQTWDSMTFTRPGVARYGVYDLKVQHVSGDDVVWLGGLGVYTYRQSVPLSVEQPQRERLGATVYPNPTTSELQVQIPGLSSGERVQLRVHNSLGQEVWRQEYTSGTVGIPVAGWASGLYLLRIGTYEGIEVLRFIKE